MNENGKSWNKFEEIYLQDKKRISSMEVRLCDIDVLFQENKIVEFYHGDVASMSKEHVDEQEAIRLGQDAVRIGQQLFPVSQKALGDLCTLCGVQGPAIADSCRERSAWLGKRLAGIRDKYFFTVRNGKVEAVKKKMSACPTVVETVNILPQKYGVKTGKGVPLKVVTGWTITDDFYVVEITYNCLSVDPELTPMVLVQDSETGESSLTIDYGCKISNGYTEGYLRIDGVKYRHDKAFNKIDIYGDALHLQDHLMAAQQRIVATRNRKAIDIEFSEDFLKLVKKVNVPMINTDGTTLYQQIANFVCSCEAIAADWTIPRRNMLRKAIQKEVISWIME